MTRAPDFDELVGKDVPDEERARLLRAHRLLVEAGPPPELSPELDSVPWPEDSQMPLLKPSSAVPSCSRLQSPRRSGSASCSGSPRARARPPCRRYAS